MRCSNAKPFRNRAPGLPKERGDRLPRIENPNAIRLSLRDAQVSPPDFLVKLELGLLESADGAAPPAMGSHEPLARFEIVEKREVGHESVPCELVHALDEAAVQASADLLVGLGRVGEAIAENEESARQRRTDDLEDVLAAVRFEEQPLRHGVELPVGLLHEHSAEDPPDSGAARLARAENRTPSPAEARGGELQLSGLPGALDPLERDERHESSKNKRGRADVFERLG